MGENLLNSTAYVNYFTTFWLNLMALRYTRPDGATVQFVGFPAAAGSSGAEKGAWSADDVEAALKARK